MVSNWAHGKLTWILHRITVVEVDGFLANGADLSDILVDIGEGSSATKVESNAGCSAIAFIYYVDVRTRDTRAFSSTE
jgi:hypothetical protein